METRWHPELAVDLIDPSPHQPRSKPTGIDELAASIAALGVIQPLIVVDDLVTHRFTVVAGHRRLAAAKKAKLETVPAIIFDAIEDAAALSRLMAENTAREDLTAVEEARGYQAMLELGLKAEDVAKATATKAEHVKLAAAVMPKADKLEKDLAGTWATLEEAAALAEFAGDKDAYEHLLRDVGSPGFAHTLEWKRTMRARAAKVKAAHDKLQKAGVQVLKDSWSGGVVHLSRIEVDGKKLTAATHKDCPGHAAAISYEGTIEYFCSTPKEHGFKAAGDRPITPEEADQEKRKRANRAKWKAAGSVRMEHVKGLILAQVTSKPAIAGSPIEHAFIADTAWAQGLPAGPSARGGYAYSGETKIVGALGWSEKAPLSVLLALAIARHEYEIVQMVKSCAGFADGWCHDRIIPRLRVYYDFLKATGYALADCEREFMDAEKPEPPKVEPYRDAIDPGVQSCRVCGCTDEQACEGGCTWVEEDLCSECVDEDVRPDDL